MPSGSAGYRDEQQEWVDGTDFLTYVRPSGAMPAAVSTIAAPVAIDPGRLRRVLTQVAAGLGALHAAGKLHRDLKPSNVLVTAQGRAVILDFGLVAELERSGQHLSTKQHIVGTADYMAPEQAAGLAVSPASDWYSVGVMLFQALTGRLPLAGGPVQVLIDKQRLDPPMPRALAPEIPEDFNALCVDLLRREPGARPSGPEVLRRLAGVGGGDGPGVPVPPTPRGPSPLLVGRERHLEALAAAFAAVERGRMVVVLASDDLQWGDADSATLLADLLRPPVPPVLLALGCYRSEDTATSPFLRGLLQWREEVSAHLDARDLAVEALTPGEARDLAQALLGGEGVAAAGWAEEIARESGGNPFFVHELAQAIRSGAGSARDAPAPGTIALDRVLLARVDLLPGDARRLLEIIAVAGRPIRKKDACRAAHLVGEDPAAVAALRSGRLIRSTGSSEPGGIETYHDRIRETVAGHLEPAVLEEHHRRLALALEATGPADPEFLAEHFQGANECEKAGHYCALAADQAAEALAFNRAAQLYRRAMQLRPEAGEAGRRQHVRLGDALANAGRGAEAAREYLAGAEGATGAEALEFRRRAAMQFLTSGHVDEGLAELRDALCAVGMRLPNTPRKALWSLIVGQGMLRLRGLGFRLRDASQIPAASLTRIDICWSAAIGLSIVDIICGAAFQARGLWLALQAGEPFRLVRALAWEAAHSATGGERTRHRTSRLLHAADALARQINHPSALGMAELARGIASYLEGRYRDAVHACDRAEAIFRDRCTGVAWEINTVQTFALWGLAELGEVAEMSRRQPVLLREARDRGDLYAETNLGTASLLVVPLAADAPEAAQEELNKVIDNWHYHVFYFQNHNFLVGRVMIALYRGDGGAAWECLAGQWPFYQKSVMDRVESIRLEFLQCRARGALAAAGSARDPQPLLRAAAADARRLERAGIPYTIALARLFHAGVAARRGDRVQATALLVDAATRFEALEMRLWATAARRRLGGLLGGDEGRALVTEANSWMRSQEIRNPDRMTALYAPGFPD